MNRKSVITGTGALIGLLIGWPFHKILLGVAIGLAVGTLIASYTRWFGGRG
ncbi:Tat pathway signal protein [Lacticaseibacillus daqingensis]|uniref:Tat pathway signal protein n=1 Tax=Lacticaseibacillus daqingensis TaxID=2486014 RepID=UPI000F7912AB|nr:Tat pathway signal protein [Lacticaseibacillus daqingensis]